MPPIERSENELITAARNGEIRAFEELVRLHRAKLRSFSLYICGGNQADADDILQEALIKAYLNIQNFRKDSAFSTWLWKIVRNEFISSKRSPYAKDTVSADSINEANLGVAPNPESEFFRDETYAGLRMLISMLPPLLKEALILVDMQEMSYEDAVKVLDISLSALKARVFQARKKLVELAAEHEELLK